MNLPSPAELLSFDELTAELKRRFPHYILVTLRDAEKDSARVEEIRMKYNGSPTLVLGLLDRGHSMLHAAIEDCEVEG